MCCSSNSTAADTMTGRARTGRRPGRPDTREEILRVARTRFAATGFDKTSIRSIAADAGVDSALVHHYFGTKRDLFVASIALPTDPTVVLRPVLAADTDRLGEALLTAILAVWDFENGQAVVATFRSLIAGADVGLIKTFLMHIVLEDIAHRVDEPVGSGPLRVALVASQMSGLLLTRHILSIEPLASMPAHRVVALTAQTLQHYLTGELPDFVP
ncbi:TetR family transcriptional regulator [Rhodococcus sp. 14-2470-1b]|nr:TetR family transcriptional regulator [Rhodococcus sp. 14-2470-1b]